MKFDYLLEGIRPLVQSIPARSVVWVAYSGGMDSSVLLHCMQTLRAQGADFTLKAVHVHHGLQPVADEWVRHCQESCNHLDVELVVLYADARAGQGESPEAVARTARYHAIAAILGKGEYLLTAHHQDDQAETYLLQLMRGSGVNGLAAMPALSSFPPGVQLRPFLEFPRDLLLASARELELEWIEDSSNENRDFDRNFIRHEIVPVFRQRWEAATRSIARSAAHMAEASLLLTERAEEDLARVGVPDKANVLQLGGLLDLSPHRLRNVLRHWLRKQGCLMPSAKKLEHVLQDVLNASAGANPCVAWSDYEIRRYRRQVYLLHRTRAETPVASAVPWNLEGELRMEGRGTMFARVAERGGIRRDLVGNPALHVRIRQGGEKVRPAGRGHTHDLKKLLQEKGIPPWEREMLPMLYCGDEIVAIPGICVCEGFQASGQEPGMELIWQPG